MKLCPQNQNRCVGADQVRGYLYLLFGPFGGWLNLDIRQMGHWCLYGGSGFLGRPRSVEERHIWSILR